MQQRLSQNGLSYSLIAYVATENVNACQIPVIDYRLLQTAKDYQSSTIIIVAVFSQQNCN